VQPGETHPQAFGLVFAALRQYDRCVSAARARRGNTPPPRLREPVHAGRMAARQHSKTSGSGARQVSDVSVTAGWRTLVRIWFGQQVRRPSVARAPTRQPRPLAAAGPSTGGAGSLPAARGSTRSTRPFFGASRAAWDDAMGAHWSAPRHAPAGDGWECATSGVQMEAAARGYRWARWPLPFLPAHPPQ